MATERKIVVVASGILEDEQDKILFLRRSTKNNSYKGHWQLPEGKMEFGETPQDSLIREVKEETSLDLKNLKLLDVLSLQMTINKFVLRKIENINYHVVRIIYHAHWKGKIVLSADHDEYNWFTPQEARQLPLTPGTEEVIKNI